MTRPIAFFDVDETLIAEKGMVGFWNHWVRWCAPAHRPAQGPRTTGADRETLNRAYFRLFAGVPRVRLEDAASQWYAVYRGGQDAFVSEAVRALLEHRAAGDEIALLTGSGAVQVRPLAEDFGVRHVLATVQLVDVAGVFTGEVRRPMIGAAKQTSARALMRRLGVRPQDCFAYGDHSSDLPMLSLVGHPVVVGDDPVLRARARALGWRRLDARRGPRPRGARMSRAE